MMNRNHHIRECGVCLRYMMNRNRQMRGLFEIYDEPQSPDEGGVFTTCDEPQSPDEGGVMTI